MGETFLISIHSTGRADLIREGKSVLRYIPIDLQDSTIVFCRGDEYADYKQAVAAQGYKVTVQYIPGILTTDKNFTVINTRQYVLDRAKRIQADYLLMIDDDLKLAVRSFETGHVVYTPFEQEDFEEMFNKLLHVCGMEYPLVGITARQFSQDKPSFDIDTRIIQLVCLHMPTLIEEGIDFKEAMDAGLVYMSDYYLCLKLLYLGYHNLCLNKYTRDDYTNWKGGCSTHRTPAEQSKSAMILTKMFPEVVMPFVKTSTGWTEKRINVRIAWKKAFGRGLI